MLTHNLQQQKLIRGFSNLAYSGMYKPSTTVEISTEVKPYHLVQQASSSTTVEINTGV